MVQWAKLSEVVVHGCLGGDCMKLFSSGLTGVPCALINAGNYVFDQMQLCEFLNVVELVMVVLSKAQ